MSALHLRIVPVPADARWDEAVSRSRGSAFHSSRWLQAVASVAQAELLPATIERDGATVGLVPLFLFRRGPFRIMASPPPLAATPYLGPVCPPELLPEVLRAVREFAESYGAAYLELRMADDLPPACWQSAGFEREARATHVLDLQPGLDTLWQKCLDPACRRAIRKAEREGVTIEEVALDAVADRYYAMAEMVFARHDRPPPLSQQDYLRIAGAIQQGATVRVLAAVWRGEIVAAGIFPFDSETVYYLDGVSDRDAQAVRPNNLLHWEVIRWAVAQGLRRYDMVGAGVPGVARFKQTFGAQERPYTYIFAYLSPLSRLARSVYRATIGPVRSLQRRWRSLQRHAPKHPG